MTGKLTTWAAKKLSYAGRRVLVQSVLQVVCSYWSGMFLLPQSVVKMIDACCRQFLWGKRSEGRALSLVNREQVCVPKKHGGLGLRLCGIWNKALLGKQLWSIANKEDSLWVRWIHGRYLKHEKLWDVTLSSTTSWHWRKLL